MRYSGYSDNENEKNRTVLDYDRSATLLLGDLTIDGSVCEVSIVPIRVGFARSGEDDASAWLVKLPG
jgi:hypothetical protein